MNGEVEADIERLEHELGLAVFSDANDVLTSQDDQMFGFGCLH